MAMLRLIRSPRLQYFDISSVILRSIGLEFPNVVVRKRALKSAIEAKESVINRSRRLALAGCGVLILPILFSIVLVALNLKD